MAVSGDSPAEDEAETGAGTAYRQRPGESVSISPWLPQYYWQRIVLLTGFWMLVVLVGVVLIRPFPPHPQLAPAIEHLTAGSRPILSIYADIILWTLAGQFAALVGWYRSHSQNDFQGQYRLWAWAALVCTAWGFFAGTDLHTAIASVAGPHLRWPTWRREIIVWLVPTALAGLSMWWLIDRDVRGSRSSLVLVRLATLVMLATGVGHLFRTELMSRLPVDALLTGLQLFGVGLVVTALWCHGWFVAYVSADPPQIPETIPWWRTLRLSIPLGWLRWPWRRAVAADEKPKRRRKKADEEEEGAEAAPKRRRRATTSKTKRTTKPRTRVKAEEVEEAEDESWDETAENSEVDTSYEEDEAWEEEATAPAPPPKPTPQPVKNVPASKPAPVATQPARQEPPQKAAPQTWNESDDDESDDGDDEGSQYRVDGAHGNAEMFKGLSKRQRRDLKKQMREQERQNQNRR